MSYNNSFLGIEVIVLHMGPQEGVGLIKFQHVLPAQSNLEGNSAFGRAKFVME
jgi:hypothetical protein